MGAKSHITTTLSSSSPEKRDITTTLIFLQEGRYIKTQEFEGVGLTPFDPYHNSSFVVAGKYIIDLRGKLHMAESLRPYGISN